MRLNLLVMKSIVFFAATGIVVHPAVADSTDCDAPFKIMFANGIYTNEVDWRASIEAIAAGIGDSYRDTPVTYDLARNRSDGFLSDIAQVFQQKIAEDSTLSWELLLRVFLGVTDLIPDSIIASVRSIIDTIYASKSVEFRQKFEQQYTYVDSDVSDQVSFIRNAIKNNVNRVVVVAHSQGNMYANAAYRLVYAQGDITTQSMVVTGVASPADFVAGNGTYVTSENDTVIRTVRQYVAAATLPANFTIPFSMDDPTGHFFIKTYLKSGPGGAKQVIFDNIIAALDKVERPEDSTDFEIRLPIAHYDEPAGSIDAGENVSYGAAHNCIPSSIFFEWAGYCRGSNLKILDLWSLKKRGNTKINSFDPQANQTQVSEIAAEVRSRIQPYTGSIMVGSPLYAFTQGKGPYYLRLRFWQGDAPVVDEAWGFNEQGPTVPFDQLTGFDFVYSPPYTFLYPSPRTVFETKFSTPLITALRTIPKEVARLEIGTDDITLKVCRQPRPAT